jgi:MaoC like domain
LTEVRAIASRVVSSLLQESFAALSGDRNPMHMDPVAARRTPAGQQVVHGVHTLLWALDALIISGHIVSPLVHIKAKFLNWVCLGEESVLSLPRNERTDPGMLLVEVGGMPVLTADLLYGEWTSAEPAHRLVPSPAEPIRAALALTFPELDSRTGDAFTARAEDGELFFPHLAAAIGATAVAEIAACSYIVGMETPGLYSSFSKLDLTIARSPHSDGARSALHYAVVRHDERFRKAQLAVTGRAIRGTLDVFLRVPPVEQASMQAVAAQVDATEFAAMRALIIGGSRGLGELTAKLIASGGGHVTITYALGNKEAEGVADQLRSWGAPVDVLPYDVRLAPKPQLERLSAPPTHIFYFATNTIFRPKSTLVSGLVLAEFTTYYLQGFYDLCSQLTEPRGNLPLGSGKLIAYYPSSVYVEERPAGMTEYAMIKAAGEQMCRDMNRQLPNLHILTTRLPRLLTDQTASLLPEHDLDPISVLLPVVREMMQLAK